MKRFLLLAVTSLTLAGTAIAQQSLTVTHGSVPTPTYIDLGEPGPSVGDQRIWQFDGQTPDRETVMTNWVMTTTSQGRPVPEMESRVTLGIFAFGKDEKNTILIQGVGSYPMTGSTLKSATVLQRAVIGGTGKYAGATGTVTSTHFEDDTWQHVFDLK